MYVTSVRKKYLNNNNAIQLVIHLTIVEIQMENTNRNDAMSLMNCGVGDNFNISSGDAQLDFHQTGDYDTRTTTADLKCWDYWQNHYYPSIIRESYPLYIQEKSQDKGKRAYEIIKNLKDKRLVHVDTVKDFIELMDFFIKEL